MTTVYKDGPGHEYFTPTHAAKLTAMTRSSQVTALKAERKALPWWAFIRRERLSLAIAAAIRQEEAAWYVVSRCIGRGHYEKGEG